MQAPYIKNKLSSVLNLKKDDLDKIIKENPKLAVRKIAIPTLVSLLFLSLNSLIDSIWVSFLGPTSVAGVGFVTTIFIIIIGIGNGIGVSANVKLSLALSNNNKEESKNIVSNSIILTIISSLIISLILVLSIGPVFNWWPLGLALNPALDYGYILFGGIGVFFFASVIPSILRASGEINKSMVAMISTSFLNMILDPILIFKCNLGVKGAALATLSCSFLCCLMLAYYVFKSIDMKFNIKEIIYRFNIKLINTISRLAIPISSEYMILSVSGMVFLNLFFIFGAEWDVAVFTLVNRFQGVYLIPISALSSSAVTVTAYLYGTKSFKKLKDILKYIMRFSLMIMFIIWIINILVPMIILSYYPCNAFNTDVLVKLPIYAFNLIPLSFGLIATASLQGISKGKTSFCLSIMRSLLLECLFAFIFACYLNLGVYGLYYGFIVGSVTGSFISLITSKRIINKQEEDSYRSSL